MQCQTQLSQPTITTSQPEAEDPARKRKFHTNGSADPLQDPVRMAPKASGKNKAHTIETHLSQPTSTGEHHKCKTSYTTYILTFIYKWISKNKKQRNSKKYQKKTEISRPINKTGSRQGNLPPARTMAKSWGNGLDLKTQNTIKLLLQNIGSIDLMESYSYKLTTLREFLNNIRLIW